jgi:hypothetical protein
VGVMGSFIVILRVLLVILRGFDGVWWLFWRFAVILVLILCQFGAFFERFLANWGFFRARECARILMAIL